MTIEDSPRIVFMGSPEFAVPSLQGLYDAGYDVAAAVTQPDRPSGRGGRLHAPPVKVAATELGIPVLQPDTLKDPAIQAEIAALQAELLVVAAYGKILPRAVLGIAPRGAINVHASLLPRWRGASPVTAAILAGDDDSGVSIMELVPKMDAGPVFARQSVPIEPSDTTGTLTARLAGLGAGLLVESLPGWLEGCLESEPQDQNAVTVCGRVQKEDGKLRTAMHVSEAERAVRAYNPWPGASVGYRDGRLAIWRAHVAGSADLPIGSFLVHEGLPAVAFTGGLLVLDEIQRSGARRVAGRDFLNGERGSLPPVAGLLS